MNMNTEFVAVRDTNRKRIRGLWSRGEKYYLQVRLPGEKTPRKVPLKADSLSEAKAAMEDKRAELRHGKVPTRGRKPGFFAFAEEYLRILEAAERPPKSPRTIYEERLILDKWKAHLGSTRIDQISPAQISAYRDARLVSGVAPRTINLHLTVLRNVLAKGVADGILSELPRLRRFRNSESRAPSRPRLSDADFEKLCAGALAHGGRNGQLLHDLLRFLGYSGARKAESLRMLWKDVDLHARMVTFRNPKGGVARSMEMNPTLHAHLHDMNGRRDPDGSYLFPSPERGGRDEPATNLAEAFKRTAIAAGLDKFALLESKSDPRLRKRVRLGLHDLRRYFATRVMEKGADPQTVSRWLGHKDGGALLLKTYASVRAEHRAAIAASLDLAVKTAVTRTASASEINAQEI